MLTWQAQVQEWDMISEYVVEIQYRSKLLVLNRSRGCEVTYCTGWKCVQWDVPGWWWADEIMWKMPRSSLNVGKWLRDPKMRMTRKGKGYRKMEWASYEEGTWRWKGNGLDETSGSFIQTILLVIMISSKNSRELWVRSWWEYLLWDSKIQREILRGKPGYIIVLYKSTWGDW